MELRRQTRGEHEALDRHPAFAALMDGTLSLDGYRRLMLLFHGDYSALDAALEADCELFGLAAAGFRYEARTGLLADDLAALGFDDVAISGNPAATELPRLGSRAALAGALYVFEGSLLGGAMLCRATEAILAREDSGGNAYWRWCRTAAGPRWAMTCRQVEALSGSEDQRADMAAAARGAFRSFADWLERWQPDMPSRGASPC
ncbi:MAG: biliverdin-producing heme oxygenase [Mesorhizobium sp.]|nr:biliverdin-producing heme oxygenase [Mesorhizobium sp.]